MIANLCKIKIIRNFLSLYKEDCWEKLICNMVEYGIILLKKKKNISAMSSDDIINFVEDFKRTEGLLSPINNINNKKSSNSKSKKISNNSFLDKSITSNYSTKSSKSVNKKRNYSVKPKSKSKQKFFKRNESFSYKKSVKKGKKINKSFSGSENMNNKNHNYTRIKIDSNRESTNTNNYNFKKNETFGGQQAFKDSFNSLSSKDTFFTNKKINNNNYNFTSNKKSSKKNIKLSNTDNFKKNINNNSSDIYSNTQISNKNTNSNINNKNKTSNNTNKKKKKGNNGAKTRTIKIESKIKDLIQKDKNNFINTGGVSNNNFNDINNNHVYALPMSAIDELGSLRSNNDIPTKTSNDSLRINIGNKNNNINNNMNNNINNINNNMNNNINMNNNNDFNNNNSISTITSLEDKLNGLTLKLSKLNESINNNKKKLSSYSNIDQFSMYSNIDIKKENKENDNISPFTNIGLGNTVLNNINDLNNINEREDNNMKIHSGLNNYLGLKQMDYNNNFEENKILNNNINNENDEDYLGEEQINL